MIQEPVGEEGGGGEGLEEYTWSHKSTKSVIIPRGSLGFLLQNGLSVS